MSEEVTVAGDSQRGATELTPLVAPDAREENIRPRRWCRCWIILSIITMIGLGAGFGTYLAHYLNSETPEAQLHYGIFAAACLGIEVVIFSITIYFLVQQCYCCCRRDSEGSGTQSPDNATVPVDGKNQTAEADAAASERNSEHGSRETDKVTEKVSSIMSGKSSEEIHEDAVSRLAKGFSEIIATASASEGEGPTEATGKGQKSTSSQATEKSGTAEKNAAPEETVSEERKSSNAQWLEENILPPESS